MRTLEVVLGDRSYPIHIGGGLLSRAGELLADIVGRRTIVITNTTVATHHLAPLRNSLTSSGIGVDCVLVPDGEAYKSWATSPDLQPQSAFVVCLSSRSPRRCLRKSILRSVARRGSTTRSART